MEPEEDKEKDEDEQIGGQGRISESNDPEKRNEAAEEMMGDKLESADEQREEAEAKRKKQDELNDERYGKAP